MQKSPITSDQMFTNSTYWESISRSLSVPVAAYLVSWKNIISPITTKYRNVMSNNIELLLYKKIIH